MTLVFQNGVFFGFFFLGGGGGGEEDWENIASHRINHRQCFLPILHNPTISMLCSKLPSWLI